MKFFRRTRLYILLCLAGLGVNNSFAQNSFKIFLVGDAGDHEESGETLKNLQKKLIENPNSAVVFLGDNCYKDILWGIIPFGYKGFDSTRNTIDKIRSQLSLVTNYNGSVFFIPGNHDWWNQSYLKGQPKLQMEESFISKNLKENACIANPGNVFLPEHGGYGPEFVDLNNKTVRLVFIDTYRIIQTGIKKNKIPAEEISFYKRLDTIIRTAYSLNEKVIVVGHHPVYSISPYNKELTHPYWFRRIKASDMEFPSYHSMASKLNAMFRHYPGIYYASGHLHALQYFSTKDSIHYIISGSGSKENILSKKEIVKYERGPSASDYVVWNSGGFFELEFHRGYVNSSLYYKNASLKCLLDN